MQNVLVGHDTADRNPGGSARSGVDHAEPLKVTAAWLSSTAAQNEAVGQDTETRPPSPAPVTSWVWGSTPLPGTGLACAGTPPATPTAGSASAEAATMIAIPRQGRQPPRPARDRHARRTPSIPRAAFPPSY